MRDCASVKSKTHKKKLKKTYIVLIDKEKSKLFLNITKKMSSDITKQ